MKKKYEEGVVVFIQQYPMLKSNRINNMLKSSTIDAIKEHPNLQELHTWS